MFCLLCMHPLIQAQEDRPDRDVLPKLADMVLPSADELIAADNADKELDWIVIRPDSSVIVCNPLYPRPDTLKKMDEERKQLESARPATDADRQARSKRLEQLSRLTITLPGDAVTEYRFPFAQIEQIILFEDLLLQRVDKLLESGEIRKAYDLLLIVEREIPQWEKSVPRFENLLLKESQLKAESGDIYAALALLDELAARNINHPELKPRFGRLVGAMIETAVQESDFPKARYLVSRIAAHFPDHESVVQWNRQFAALAAAELDKAVKLYDARQFAEATFLAREAERIAPSVGNARVAYGRIMSRYQILRVAVESFSGRPLVFPAATRPEARHRELVEVPLFEPAAADEVTSFRSSFFEEWDPSDLGREVVLTLRSTRPHWQTQPILTANQIADAIAMQLDPQDPLFNSRLSSFVRGFSVRSPTELKLRFSRVPMSIESLFRFPVTTRLKPTDPEAMTTAEAAPITVSTPDATATTVAPARGESSEPPAATVLSTRFELSAADSTMRVYRRRIPEPDGLDTPQYHVAEIVERLYPDRHQLIQALVRGEVEFLPTVRPWEIDAFESSPSLIARRQALPLTHVITFNPLSKNITSAQLRRALSLSIDREAILQRTVLRDPAMKHGRPTSAAWHQSSYATNPLEKAPPYNIRLAYALRFAAEKQLQIAELGRLEAIAKEKAKAEKSEFKSAEFREATNVEYIRLPSLRLVVEPDEVAVAAAEKIIVYWKKIGFDVQLIQGDQEGPPLPDAEWDMMYRRVRMEEPLLDLWPLLTNDPKVQVDRLESFPDWMRQELINLDYAGSFVEAQSRLFTIHRHVAAQAFLIPLWEVDEYMVFHKTVSGYADRPMSTYQNVERWTLRP